MTGKTRVAAIQLEAEIGDLQANLTACENMANEAGEKGAKWILLPEFFTTGMAFNPSIADAIQGPDSPALKMLLNVARRHRAYVGGSFIMRDEDSIVRNAFFLVSPEGIVGRHNKDIPTMWENCFYVGGTDDGIMKVEEKYIGVALCWEFMRSRTARRLRGKVDAVVGGSCWWSVPSWAPGLVTGRWEEKNEETALESVRSFATYVGAPIIHAAHVGQVECSLPWLPMRYRGHYEGGSMIVDSQGGTVAVCSRHAGQGILVGDIGIGRTKPLRDIPRKYWLHARGPIPAVAWNYQRWHGKVWYGRNVEKAKRMKSGRRVLPR
ncbi:MAG: carbon-nitrogen hydrolase family protein [Firmicutes bacterium]|nr:carbon-nitrogen hydrolase family protein [Bacillota bacterium]